MPCGNAIQPPAISTRATSAAEAVVERVLEQYLKPGVTNLAPGQSHWSPPPHAVPPIADVRAASRYGACHGDAALLVALREKLERENRIAMADRGLMVTCGANQAFAHAMLALCDAGDEVVLFAPYYFSHLVALQMFGLRPRVLPCEAASGVPSLGALRGALDDAGGRVRAVVLVSPGNPSGTIVPEALGRAVLRECAARGVWLVTDEAYEHFTFGGDQCDWPGARLVTPGLRYCSRTRSTTASAAEVARVEIAGIALRHAIHTAAAASSLAVCRVSSFLSPPQPSNG